MKRTSLGVIALLFLPAAVNSLSAQTPADPSKLTAVTQITAPPTQLGAPMIATTDTCNTGQGGLVAGGAFYFLKPFMNSNTAYITVTDPGKPNSNEANTTFQWNFQPAFAGWLGWTWGSGLGVRARYFQFDSTSQTDSLSNGTTPPPSSQTTINPPLTNFLGLSTGGTGMGSPGSLLNSGVGTDHLTFASSMSIRSIDLEATYLWKLSNFSFLASGGARLMELNQAFRATLSNNGGGVNASEYQQFDYSRDFTGGGLTVALQTTYQIGTSNLFLYANGRASLIVGQTQERESYLQTVNNPAGAIVTLPPFLQINPTASRSSDHTIPIVELELGAEYGINFARSRLFFRAAAVTQSYFDAGNASQATGSMTLFGVQGTIGLNY